MKIDINKTRSQFPILQQQVNKRPLVYFDNAATTQNPTEVTQAIVDYYNNYNSNIHRGTHHLSNIATEAYENTRNNIRDFINAKHSHEIIFTRGTTESINLVASSFSKAFLKEGDNIIISHLEHHSNIVPWQLACENHHAQLRVIPINEDGSLQMEELEKLIDDRTKIIAITHVSNALGVVNPIKEIIELAHKNNIPVLVDGAQAVSHIKLDVQNLDADFYCFSGHKMYAPMGIGVLYGKEKWLNQMPPYQGGGEMIKDVSFEKTTYNELPYKFEAGTPNVGDTIALKTAIKYIQELDIESIRLYEDELLHYATKRIKEIDGITIYGTTKQKTAVISFLIDGVHPYDVGVLLDKMGIAVRTGHHCTQPIMDFYKIPGTVRASFAVYNTKEEIDSFIEALKKVKEMLM
ncbi:MAG: aminotransferase class V-fold PLP-dependent enzyme [Bacteroidales bacterium]|jgi:cysteine desulfurase/selenocysteine lyase|nr:cysteine desulfurase [Bacteroidales bacterium]